MNSWPDSWTVTTLGEVAQWWSGGTPRTSQPNYWGGGIPWITSGSLTEFKLKRSDRTLTQEGVAHGSRLVPAGTTLFVVRGMSLKTEFRIGITTRPMAFGQDCKALRPRRADVDELFLAYAIRGQSARILNLVDEAGHGTGRLNTDQMKGLVLGVPPLSEQRAIAEVLGALDDKIEANERAIRLMESLVDSIFERASDVLIPLGKIASSLHETIDPTALGRRSVDLFSIPAFDEGCTPNRVETSTILSSKLIMRDPAVLVSRLNPRISRVWLADVDSAVPAMCSTEFLVLRPRQGYSLADIWGSTRSNQARTEMASRATGTSGSHQRVRPRDAMSVEVPDPGTLSDASRTLASDSLGHVAALRSESPVLASLSGWLLPMLISGELRVRDAEQLVQAAV